MIRNADITENFCDDMHRSADFNDFLAKCLLKDPAQRSTAADLLRVSSNIFGVDCFSKQ